jgi:hypothetical protein
MAKLVSTEYIYYSIFISMFYISFIIITSVGHMREMFICCTSATKSVL